MNAQNTKIFTAAVYVHARNLIRRREDSVWFAMQASM